MKYLERLKARAAEKGSPRPLTKLTKGPEAREQDLTELTKAPSGTSVGDQGGRSLESRVEWDPASSDEREALLAEGGVPEPFVEAFAALQQVCPEGVPGSRWHQFVNDCGLFLDQWGARAAALGWTPSDLFGLDPIAPMARYDRMGLCWLLKGEHIVLMSAEAATLSGGHRYRRATHQRTIA
jgi:hypothetical protein